MGTVTPEILIKQSGANVKFDAIHSALTEVKNEIFRAKLKHPGDFVNFHHGYAIMLEEVDELWDNIKKQKQDKHEIREEAMQVAAMAVRIMTELT